MTTYQPNESDADAHAAWLCLIPGYVRGGLPPTEHEAVRRHLEVCRMCRDEVSRCEALAEHWPAATEGWKPSPAHFAGILAAVDELEVATPQPAPSAFRRIAAWLSLTPAAIRWTLAAETLALAVLAAVVALPLHVYPDGDRAFETLSDAETAVTPQGKAIRVMFAEDMTTRELSELLNQARAQIRRGPSVVGSYTVDVAAGDAEQALATLRAHPKVRLAQPIADSPPDS